jgi:hypothetical protein
MILEIFTIWIPWTIIFKFILIPFLPFKAAPTRAPFFFMQKRTRSVLSEFQRTHNMQDGL